jgi:hypothetical protein
MACAQQPTFELTTPSVSIKLDNDAARAMLIMIDAMVAPATIDLGDAMKRDNDRALASGR